MVPHILMFQFHIPHVGQAVPINLEAGKPIFIVGRNGSGKSALIHLLSRYLAGQSVYLPGTRPIYFDSDNSSFSNVHRSQFEQNRHNWEMSPDMRWRPVSGTQRNEKAMFDLKSSDVSYKIAALDQIIDGVEEAKAIARVKERKSPLDYVNSILTRGNLPVQLKLIDGDLRAVNVGAPFSVAKMSDGERAALILTAEISAAPAGSIFIIDEPEVHLHRSIVVPLIMTLIKERPNCGFIISTHELDLVKEVPDCKIILVRGCSWTGDTISSWEYDTIEDASLIPEEIKTDIIGSRKKILFVEGEASSLDVPLYSILFPNASIRARGGCREVDRAVTGLRSTQDIHRAEAYGLIDNDQLSTEAISSYRDRNIFPLPVYAVESLYYCDAVLEAVTRHQAEIFMLDLESLRSSLKLRALTAVDGNDQLRKLAAKAASRKIRDQLLAKIPSSSDLLKPNVTEILLDPRAILNYEIERIMQKRSSNDLSGIIAAYPFRESQIPNAIARELRFTSRFDYESAALHMLRSNENLRGIVKSYLGDLAAHLG